MAVSLVFSSIRFLNLRCGLFVCSDVLESHSAFWHSEDQASWYILITKTNEMHYFSTLFGKELYMFRTDLLSIVRSLNTVFTAIGICHNSCVDCLLVRSGWQLFHPDLAVTSVTARWYVLVYARSQKYCVPPHPGHQQAASSVHCTTSCKHSLVFLRTGEIIARNMLNWLKSLIVITKLIVAFRIFANAYRQARKHSLVLLRTGEIIARNMLNWLKSLINLYCCI